MIDQPKKKVLIGFHKQKELRDFEAMFRHRKCEVTAVDSLDGMLEAMGLGKDSAPQDLPKNNFDAYYMDANLGHSDSPDFSPSYTVFSHVKQLYQQGKTKFLATSAIRDGESIAADEGIPFLAKQMSLDLMFERLGL